VGRRARKRQREAGGPKPAAVAATTSTYTDDEGNSLTLRDELTPKTLDQLDKLEARPAASAYDRWQRRVELLFERLATRWEIAGLPLESQKELLGRYRMASEDERRWVRETIAAHMRERYPQIDI
jgi:hypothetical protein